MPALRVSSGEGRSGGGPGDYEHHRHRDRDPRDQAHHHGHDLDDACHRPCSEPRRQRSRITDRRWRSAIWQASSYLLQEKMTQCLKQGANIESAANSARHALPCSRWGIRKPQVPPPGGGPAPGWCFAASVAPRIVRCSVLTVRNAVTISIPAPPTATLHVPAPIALRPCRLGVMIAAALAYPLAPLPIDGDGFAIPSARPPTRDHGAAWEWLPHGGGGGATCTIIAAVTGVAIVPTDAATIAARSSFLIMAIS
jgi:hypothetical protein